MKNILKVAKVIRSKNSSPFELTLDIIFKNRKVYELVKQKKMITTDSIAELYKVPKNKVPKVIFFDPAKAVKISMIRPIPSGAPGDTDVYGAQQHAPLLKMELELP
ncbi:MAG: DUF4387 domain-containing protein [Victivallaceae bacterium]|nr:DUF4387 domain-containing protein [Victivallaceae bacterium]